MAECKNCGKEVHTIGTKPRMFCSDRCRKAFSRQEQTDRIANGQEQTDKPKRGLDIKCFLDLPLDVQQTIERLCPDVAKDHAERCKRTAAAINYQRLFPGRYYPISTYHRPQDAAVTGKPGDADYNGICTKEWRTERGR